MQRLHPPGKLEHVNKSMSTIVAFIFAQDAVMNIPLSPVILAKVF